MWNFLLDIDIIDGPFIIGLYALAAAVSIYLLLRGSGWSWVLTVIVLLIVGAIVGGATAWVAVNVLDAFGGPVVDATWWWVPAAFAGIAVAIWNLWHSRWWRKLIAVLAIPIFACTAAFGINAAYGLDPTFGALFGITTAPEVDIAKPGPSPTADPTEPLYQTWQPPAGMPAKGTIGPVKGGVPNTNSAFPGSRSTATAR